MTNQEIRARYNAQIAALTAKIKECRKLHRYEDAARYTSYRDLYYINYARIPA
jgi:hypothetical protein